jgi:hypothetical protein
MIEINVDTESEIATYDRYLSQLLENDLKSSNQILDFPSSETYSTATTTTIKFDDNDENSVVIGNEILDLEKTFDDEFKWTCLLQYEEEERINKLITTTTTRTITEDILYYDKTNDVNSCLFLNDSIGDELDDITIVNNNNNNNELSQPLQVIEIPIINGDVRKLNSDGIYSNLINYTSNNQKPTNSCIVHVSSSTSPATLNNNIKNNEDENNSDVSAELVIIQPTSPSLLSSSSSKSSVTEANDSGFYSSNFKNKLSYCTDEIFA